VREFRILLHKLTPCQVVHHRSDADYAGGFRYRTRYLTDSGIIGSKEFVAENYQRFKHLFYSKHDKKPKPVKGLEGMYSLKRLSEII
jgi:hypothetical protein